MRGRSICGGAAGGGLEQAHTAQQQPYVSCISHYGSETQRGRMYVYGATHASQQPAQRIYCHSDADKHPHAIGNSVTKLQPHSLSHQAHASRLQRITRQAKHISSISLVIPHWNPAAGTSGRMFSCTTTPFNANKPLRLHEHVSDMSTRLRRRLAGHQEYYSPRLWQA